jgi:hypothetical protein
MLLGWHALLDAGLRQPISHQHQLVCIWSTVDCYGRLKPFTVQDADPCSVGILLGFTRESELQGVSVNE